LKGILSEHSEQAPMFIKNSFQSTALTWILSLGKKLSLQLRKNRTACLIKSHADGGGHAAWARMRGAVLRRKKVRPLEEAGHKLQLSMRKGFR